MKTNKQIAAEIRKHREKNGVKIVRKFDRYARPEEPPKEKRFKSKPGGARVVAWRSRDDFYLSELWRSVRYKALLRDGGRCLACGASAKDGVRIHVDHIKGNYILDSTKRISGL